MSDEAYKFIFRKSQTEDVVLKAALDLVRVVYGYSGAYWFVPSTIAQTGLDGYLKRLADQAEIVRWVGEKINWENYHHENTD